MVACKAVVLVGTECSGKSTLAGQLSAELGAVLVPEVARGWLAARNNEYVEADLLTIAHLQWQAEAAAHTGAALVLADTDLCVLQIWSEVRFGRCDPWIRDQLAVRPPAFYLLTAPDLPWQADGQRQSPHLQQRQALHQRYRKLLTTLAYPFAEIGGQGAARLQAAQRALHSAGLPDPGSGCGRWSGRG